jgi:nickel-type superoxide dismutase maturation protease
MKIAWPVKIRRVEGRSMLPTLKPGKIVIGYTFSELKKGNLVIAEHNNQEIIKRIDDIGDEGLYLVGDNKAESTDSRTYGWINIKAVKAKVIWPKGD